MLLVTSLLATAFADGFNTIYTLPILDIPGLGDGPSGNYVGEVTILGQKITGDLTFAADTVAFKLGGKVDIDCPNEKYTCDASGDVKLTDIGDPNDCAAKALTKYNAKLETAKYDSGADTVTINLDAILKIALVLHKAGSLQAPVLGATPAGQYTGTKTVLGQKFTATMKFSTSTVEFTIAGPVALDCPNEPYTYSSGTIDLTNLGNSDDCVKTDLDKYSAKLETLKYDESADKVTATVKYSILHIDLEMDKVSGEMVLKVVELTGPAGEYKGTKKVLGESLTATMKFSTTTGATVEFAISGPVSLDCPNEPYTYSNGKVTLTNLGSDSDCVEHDLKKYKASLTNLAYDESADTVTATVKYSFLHINVVMKKQSGELIISA